MKARKLVTGSLAFVALLLGGCATEPSLYTGKTSYFGYTWQQELQLGEEADSDIVQQMGRYPDDAVGDYVKEIGATLMAHSAIRQDDAPELYRDTEFTFRVLDSPVVNAFALPGGYVYVTRGLLAHLNNEAQLAMVIGHEITHVEARHASQRALKQQWGQIGLLAGAVIGEQIAENKELARQMVDLGGSLFQLVTLKYGRDDERESDYHGVQYAAKAGYDAAEGSAFFRSLSRISEKSGQTIPNWMSSHPDPGEREETIQELAAKWRDENGGEARINRERYLQMIEGLVVGENPRNGYTEDGHFYHPDLRLQFDTPEGWTVQNDSGAVYLIEPGKSAILAFTIAKEATPLAAAQALKQRLNLEPTYAQDDRINGLPAYLLEGVARSETAAIPVYSAFVQYRENVYGFLGYGNPETFSAHKPALQRVARSFQELTNPGALNVQPFRIAISPAERSAPFSELLPSSLPPGTDARDWAIMNQIELDQRIERGATLKLPTQAR